MHDDPFLVVKKGFAAELSSAAKAAFGIELGIEETLKQIVVPVEGRGDISSSIAFRIAFSAKTTPHIAAEKIVEKMGRVALAEKIEELDG
jgi:arginyl-tRNA synthetase